MSGDLQSVTPCHYVLPPCVHSPRDVDGVQCRNSLKGPVPHPSFESTLGRLRDSTSLSQLSGPSGPSILSVLLCRLSSLDVFSFESSNGNS